MIRTTTWVCLTATICLAGCQPAANTSTSKLSSNASVDFVTQVESLRIDRARIVPIKTPINVAMQPMQSVAYTEIESNVNDLDAKMIIRGRVWFERNKDGRIEQHKEVVGGSLQSKRRNANIDLQVTGSEVVTFEPDGRVWSIEPVQLQMPSTAPAEVNQKGWDAIRESLIPSRPYQNTDQVVRCAGNNFTYAKGSIQTGTPVLPRTRREFFDRVADCMIAMARGNPSPTHPDDIAFRKDIMGASDAHLHEIHDYTRDFWSDRWTESLADFSSDVTVKGMVVENGQEFAYAEGSLSISGVSNGDHGQGRSRVQVLIDPYSGLIYQSVLTTEISGVPASNPDYAKFHGMLQSTALDLPSRTPTNVTIAEPRQPVTSGGQGTVVDIYRRSIDAIYEVDTKDGLGTAFAVSDRQAITAAHVVGGEQSVTLISMSGARMTATVVKRDTQRDVALLQLTGASFPVALRLSRDFAVTGAQVIVIGCPLGACGSVTTGIVSFSARRIEGAALVQIDAQVNPGNSGGPILNTNGDVIGIVREKLVPDPDFDGLSFGLASPEVVQFVGS